MAIFDAEYSVFIDYDNLGRMLQQQGLLSVIQKILMVIKHDTSFKRVKCSLRIYGGWYENDEITSLAQVVIREIENDFPYSFHYEKWAFSIDAEIALTTMEEPNHHLLNTFRRKDKVQNVRIKKQDDVGCTDPNCLILQVKKLLKTGKCPRNGCSVEDVLLYRNEQKIVDTMLSCDIVYSSVLNKNLVVVVSSDDDFIPPIRSIALRGIPTYRCHPKKNGMRIPMNMPSSPLNELEI